MPSLLCAGVRLTTLTCASSSSFAVVSSFLYASHCSTSASSLAATAAARARDCLQWPPELVSAGPGITRGYGAVAAVSRAQACASLHGSVQSPHTACASTHMMRQLGRDQVQCVRLLSSLFGARRFAGRRRALARGGATTRRCPLLSSLLRQRVAMLRIIGGKLGFIPRLVLGCLGLHRTMGRGGGIGGGSAPAKVPSPPHPSRATSHPLVCRARRALTLGYPSKTAGGRRCGWLSAAGGGAGGNRAWWAA
eukprot:scaffold160591_cov26-Tisochrysis_lutea.AAC.3